jgi:hypothetical protein
MNQSFKLSRRAFLRIGTLSLAAAMVARPGASLAATVGTPTTTATRGKARYAFILLGDMHYDAPAHHDMEWVRREKAGDVRQIEGYCAVTANHTPHLMQRVKQIISQSEVPVAFIIQNGDLVEGLCGSFELQAKQFHDVAAMVDQMQFGVPFLVNKGNHDITGPGAADAYNKVLLPWLSAQAGQKLSTAAFLRRQDDDLFVFFDAYKPDLDWLEQSLQRHADARHTFFCTHPPVVPADARANWCLFAGEQEAARRQRLLEMLGKRQAIVFSGHMHKASFLVRETPTGRFCELGTCSVVRSDPFKPIKLASGIDHYGEELTNLEPNFSPSTLAERQRILREEKPAIRQYELGDAPGCTLITVYDDHVLCDSYAATSTTAWDSRPLATEVRL